MPNIPTTSRTYSASVWDAIANHLPETEKRLTARLGERIDAVENWDTPVTVPLTAAQVLLVEQIVVDEGLVVAGSPAAGSPPAE
jgi:hypothetical protein